MTALSTGPRRIVPDHPAAYRGYTCRLTAGLLASASTERWVASVNAVQPRGLTLQIPFGVGGVGFGSRDHRRRLVSLRCGQRSRRVRSTVGLERTVLERGEPVEIDHVVYEDG